MEDAQPIKKPKPDQPRPPTGPNEPVPGIDEEAL